MKLSVAICTYNRAPLLRGTLGSLEEVAVPDGVDWEVLVVDNNCTDRTPEVLEEFGSSLPLRGVTEERQGLSHARNRATLEASGDYLLWSDDDVLFSPGYLTAYAEAIDRWPDTTFFGGPIYPFFEGETPDWLVKAFDEIDFVYGTRDLGGEPFRFRKGGPLPYGGNLVVRKEVQKEHSYDSRLGRRGRDLIGDEEIAMLEELLDSGHDGRWVPGAEVRHVITEDRQTLSHVRRYMRGKGKIASFRGWQASDSAVLFGRPLWAWRQAVEHELRYWIGRPVKSPEQWIVDLKHASYAQGVLLGSDPRNGSETGDSEVYR